MQRSATGYSHDQAVENTIDYLIFLNLLFELFSIVTYLELISAVVLPVFHELDISRVFPEFPHSRLK